MVHLNEPVDVQKTLKAMRKPTYETLESPRPAFMDELASYGFEARKGVKLPPVPEIGRIVRIAAPDDKQGKQSGWYWYNEFTDDLREGAAVGVGVFGSWKGHPERAEWFSKRRESMSPVEVARLSEQIEAAKMARDLEIAERQKAAAQKAQKIWDDSIPAPVEHPYLTNKNIQPHGVRVSRGKLVIPMLDSAGVISSLQFIGPDSGKKFLFGGMVKGCCFSIGEPGEVIYVTEGFATAATIYVATGCMCYIAYNAGNLVDVARHLRKKYKLPIIVAGDDDRFTEGNPGRIKAEAVAAQIENTSCLFPVFVSDDGKPTDFNDLHCREGLDAVKKILTKPLSLGLPIVWADEINLNFNRSYIVKGLLDTTAMSVVYGQSNVGKSFFAIDLSIHVAAGMEFRDMRVNAGGVVYVAAESGESVQRRVLAICDDKKLSKLPFAIVPTGVDLLDPNADTSRLIASIFAAAATIDLSIELVVIDTLSRSFGGGDENTSKDMTTFIANMDRIREETGAHIMIVHHAGKDDAKGARGHSSLRAATDTEISIKRATNDKFSIASIDKQRDGKNGDKLPFELRPVELGTDEDGDSVTTCVVVAQEPSGDCAGPKLSARQAMAKRALSDLWLEEKPGKKGITFNRFKELLISRGIIDEDTKRLRQTLCDLRQKLESKGVITIRDRRIHLFSVSPITVESEGVQ